MARAARAPALALLALAAAAAPAPPCVAESSFPASLPGADGYLRQQVAVVVFTDPETDRLPEEAEWILTREIRAFEAFVWEHSGERLLVEAVRIEPGRALGDDEFEYRGPRWGYQPRPGPEIAADIERMGWSPSQFSGLLVLYEPPPARPTPVAGVTWGRLGFSAIALKDYTFRDAGRRYPLHLLLAHEFLHQMERAFATTTGSRYLDSPDDEDLRDVLGRNARGSEIEWRLLSPGLGSWVSR